MCQQFVTVEINKVDLLLYAATAFHYSHISKKLILMKIPPSTLVRLVRNLKIESVCTNGMHDYITEETSLLTAHLLASEHTSKRTIGVRGNETVASGPPPLLTGCFEL